MLQLAEHCRKEAFKNPGGCRDAATAAAKKACEGVSGRGLTNCMNLNFEHYLVKKCGEMVCPNDPFMIKDSGQNVSSKTSSERAGEGGLFSTTHDVTATEFESSSRKKGTDPIKVRNMVLGGLALMAVLILATGKRK